MEGKEPNKKETGHTPTAAANEEADGVEKQLPMRCEGTARRNHEDAGWPNCEGGTASEEWNGNYGQGVWDV